MYGRLALKTYYRMDTTISTGGEIVWPIEHVLRPEGLGSDQVGVFGWFGDEEDRTFVPVLVYPDQNKVPIPATVELKLRSPIDLELVRWRVRSDKADLGDDKWQQASTGPVDEGDTLSVRLPIGPPAKLRVDFVAKRRNMNQWLTVSFHVIRAD